MRALERARALVRTNYGRRDGWSIEFRGVTVGELEDPKRVELFWDSYAVRFTAPSRNAVLVDDELWKRGAFVFRNRRTGEVAPHAFCSGPPPFIRDGRVVMRGLYLVPSSLLERACLCVLDLLR
jgi:hypothetical protein